ncbi:DUF397 domain-containing protein [Amycolatopsis minnesotensis]|uniref:DUF397 domain-containing protein n=1 Tax=Amycolatopsis minnesotensis TaxID=337894 RepID=UPI0031D67DE5
MTRRNSSYSNESGQTCVEVAEVSTGAAVRDSKAPQSGHLTVPRTAWQAFLTTARMP